MNCEKRRNLRLRSELFRAIRDCFYRAGYWEVETPVKIHAPAPEETIESVRAEQDFLRTSPELAMKVLLADGLEKIFQIGPCFRAGESGRRHREEFTMLEFYSRGTSYRELAEFTAHLVGEAAMRVLGSTQMEYQGKVLDLSHCDFVTVNDAFRLHAGCTAYEAEASNRFDELMVTHIEPKLGNCGLTFLFDYPATRASLARLRADDPSVAERWELYLAGIELANAFGELTDEQEQRKRFQSALNFRAAAGMHAYPEPLEFFSALKRGLPESSGCAMGLDRLTMVLCGADDIGDVRI